MDKDRSHVRPGTTTEERYLAGIWGQGDQAAVTRGARRHLALSHALHLTDEYWLAVADRVEEEQGT